MMDIQKIKELALANGFSLKPQASGNMDLHSYVYEFAQAVADEVRAQINPVNFQKESEAFDAWHYQDWRSNISTDIDESEYPELYRRIYSHFSTQCERELQFKTWLAAKASAIPEGFVLIRKRNMVGNPSVDWSQAPRWAKYWLKDGHSNKYWWSSTRPTKDMGLNAFCWKGDYFAEEAPSFGFDGLWDKSLTSKKAMIEAAEDSNREKS